MKFRFEDALNMQGETGPYLQYAHARLCSIERRFAQQFANIPTANPALLSSDAEKAVLLAVARLQGALERVVDEDELQRPSPGLVGPGLGGFIVVERWQ